MDSLAGSSEEPPISVPPNFLLFKIILNSRSESIVARSNPRPRL